MSDSRKPRTDDVLRESAGILKDLESFDMGTDDPASAESMDEAVRAERLRKLQRADLEERDGYVAVTVSEDGMAATATFYPPIGNGAPVAKESVMQLVADKGVSHGILESEISNALLACTTERREIGNVEIAHGKEPVTARSAHIALRQSLFRDFRKRPAKEGRVDYRSISRFVLVEEGELLAKVIPEQGGRAGFTVYGEELAFAKRKVRSPRPGKNVARDGERFYATIAGRLEWDQSGFSVLPVLELTEDVDYHTGHIDFPGDVVLHKEVRDNFKIHAEGSVFCMGTLDASDVSCGGNLVARSGIIGRNKAVLRVGGSVQAKYIENCDLEAGGNVRAEVAIVNSSVNALGAVTTGPRGVIVGGTLYAVEGVRAAQCGTATGPKTSIHCGTDYKAAHRLKWVQDKNLEVALQLERVRGEKGDGGDARLAETEARLEAALEKLQSAAEQLVVKVDRNDAAQVEVSGTVFPGTYLEICHVAHEVHRERRRARFALNKRRGVVEATSLNTAPPPKVSLG